METVLIYLQFSNKFFENSVPNNAKVYNDLIYKSIPGYEKSEHYFEFPLWIARISGLVNHQYREVLYTIETLIEAEMFIKGFNKHDVIIFASILDINKKYYDKLFKSIKGNNIKIVTGGYSVFEQASHNFYWFESLEDAFVRLFDRPVNDHYSYHLHNYKEYLIPRLTFTEGCNNNCKFCCVPRGVTERSYSNIQNQYLSFKDLNFELVYIDDKTFTVDQMNLLRECYNEIKGYNSEFKGFIVQTIANVDVIEMLTKCDVIKYVEIGLEIYSDNILQLYNKPTNTKEIDKLFMIAPKTHKIIPNLIVGFPEASINDYLATLDFLSKYEDKISHFNIYNLAYYNNTPIGKQSRTTSDFDHNELDFRNSYCDVELAEYIENCYYELGTKLINKHYGQSN